jgi:hypothetical protein
MLSRLTCTCFALCPPYILFLDLKLAHACMHACTPREAKKSQIYFFLGIGMINILAINFFFLFPFAHSRNWTKKAALRYIWCTTRAQLSSLLILARRRSIHISGRRTYQLHIYSYLITDRCPFLSPFHQTTTPNLDRGM